MARRGPDSVTVHGIADEILLMMLNILPALFFLLVYGILLGSGTISGVALIFVGIAFVIDLASEAWLFVTPFQYENELLRRLILLHYTLNVGAYIALAFAVFGTTATFTAYSLFLLIWLFSFLMGEATVMFLDEEYEAWHRFNQLRIFRRASH